MSEIAAICRCPICNEDIISTIDQAHARQELAKHIVGKHTKRINGQPTIQVPQEALRIIGKPNREQRRAAMRAKRGGR